MDGLPMDDQPAPDLRALAERLQGLCLAGGWTVATAESCTGGLVADLLTDVPGSSGYVRGGIVSYADDVKIGQLGVPGELIRAHGAVSPHVARAMAVGARERLGATFAVSVTGIAGPDGGSASKPVGLTYVGLAGPAGIDVRRYAWPGDRAANKRSSATAAIELLVEAAEAEATRDATVGEPPGQGAPAGSAR
jgi:PncC family amidohydrolase